MINDDLLGVCQDPKTTEEKGWDNSSGWKVGTSNPLAPIDQS